MSVSRTRASATATSFLLLVAFSGLMGLLAPPCASGQPPGAAQDNAKKDNPRVCTRPATIQAFETVRMFARVSGYLKEQKVDIGDRVKKGQVLAVLDVPEIEAQLRRDRAASDRTRARLLQVKLAVTGREADLEVARAALKQAKTAAQGAAATVVFRSAQHDRMKALSASKAIEEQLLEESKGRWEAAVQAEESAKAALDTAKAQIAVCQNQIEQAKAGVLEAEADVQAADMKLQQTQVRRSFAIITAPFDGIITHRGYFVGDFIRSAETGAKRAPLLIVERTDRLRAVVAVPDRDVPFLSVSSHAELVIDGLPGKKWVLKVSRVAHTLDPTSRCMHVELDLADPAGRIHPGMYGTVSIPLER